MSKAKEPVTYFIADLHLAQNRPDITACFLSFLKNKAPEAEALYILGDLFESWIGDDDNSPFVIEIAQALFELRQKHTEIFYIHGNRDFLLGKKYAQKSGMTLLAEVELIELYGKKAVIMHGDTLCTRDIGYQKFRKKSRSWWWQTMIKSLPLFVRRNIAENYRKKSAMATAEKSQEIMDVTPQEVVNCLEQYNSQLLIHGHTHRPAVHELNANNQAAQRVVLGDWYEQGAWLKVTRKGFELLNQPFPNGK
ncbi:UDP-2,3-diacylglucosamine diphosphatase [Thalassomonas viridans]|uniref:UDP-2,3-diacylglucosamine hydrolase n=2 Tax=Thalassomonas viridans TaxID=137584 RepID=A0AAF0CDR7_9GAMM|nr:UDP-2,3-diacylglucosamine diphosphatase [Thalassomonas viridans]